MRLPLLAACISACLALAAPLRSAEIPGIIFDSDMSSDHDDLADMAVLEALADRGECRILACMCSSRNGGTPLCMNAINTYYGRPDIPCGRRPDAGGPGGYPGQIAAEFPHPLYATWQDPPLAADLYRKVLAAQPDHSVTVVTTGFFNNLQALMLTGPDAVSPLSGMDLIKAKIRLLSCAAGCYPKGDEFNFRVEPKAAAYVINHWPVAACFDGYDVGQDIYSGGGLAQTPKTNPIRRGFELTFFGPYPTWGQLMVYYAVRANESQALWDYHATGHNALDPTGHNWWTDANPPVQEQQRYMLEIEREPIQQSIDTLVMDSAHPESQGTHAPPNQPTDLRARVAGNHRIDLEWTDNAWNATGFTIERRINGTYATLATTGPGITTYADTRLSSTARVAYRVTATNAIGRSPPTTLTVYADGWTEHNLSHPADTSPIYHCYQYDNLNWIRGPRVCEHIAINNDSMTGQDLDIHVLVGAQGGYGSYFVYFLYQDQNNWYRLNAGSIAEKKRSQFEKCVDGHIIPIGPIGDGVNIGNGSLMQTWDIIVTHTGAMIYRNNNNPNGNALPTLHDVVTATDTFAVTHGQLALGSNDGQPVWDDFTFDTNPAAVAAAASASPPPVPETIAATTSVHPAPIRSIAPAVGLDPILTGTVISDGGGAFGNTTNTADKSFDGEPTTFYDAARGGLGWVGLDLGDHIATVTAIRFWARAGFTARMAGGVFEGANSLGAGGWTRLATVASASDTAWTTVRVTGAAAYRYVRYRAAAGSWCNVAEVEFHGNKASSTR